MWSDLLNRPGTLKLENLPHKNISYDGYPQKEVAKDYKINGTKSKLVDQGEAIRDHPGGAEEVFIAILNNLSSSFDCLFYWVVIFPVIYVDWVLS